MDETATSGGRLRRAFLLRQSEGWQLAGLTPMGIGIATLVPGAPWQVVAGAAILVIVVWRVGALVWSGRRAAGGDEFWRHAPDGVAASLFVLGSIPMFNRAEPWSVAVGCVFLAIGLWGGVVAVIRVVRTPEQVSGL